MVKLTIRLIFVLNCFTSYCTTEATMHDIERINAIVKKLGIYSPWYSYNEEEFEIVRKYLFDETVPHSNKVNFFKQTWNVSFYKKLMQLGYKFYPEFLAIEYRSGDTDLFEYLLNLYPDVKFDTEFVEDISMRCVDIERLKRFIKLGMDLNLSKKWIRHNSDFDVEKLVEMGLIIQDQNIKPIECLTPNMVIYLLNANYRFPVTQGLHNAINIMNHVLSSERDKGIAMLENQGARADCMSVICSCATLEFLKILKKKGANMKLIELAESDLYCPCDCGGEPEYETLVWLTENDGPDINLANYNNDDYVIDLDDNGIADHGSDNNGIADHGSDNNGIAGRT